MSQQVKGMKSQLSKVELTYKKKINRLDYALRKAKAFAILKLTDLELRTKLT